MKYRQHDGAAMARWLGYLGLVPFIAGAAIALVGDAAGRDLGVRAVIAYGAVIVSFVGAIHWGLALQAGGERAATIYLVGVVPSLLAWLALLLTPQTGLILLISAFVFIWIYERARLVPSLFPDWFARLRTHLTGIAVVILAGLLFMAPSI